MHRLTVTSLDDMAAFAKAVSSRLKRGDVITLAGDLGAGKTTFAQFLIQALSTEAVEVTSPTFTLMQSYSVQLQDKSACEFYHFDLYRIETESALIELGLDDIVTGVSLIEWPERLGSYPIPVSLALSISFGKDGERHITLLHGASHFKELIS